jgi:hypothetical protein
MPVPYRLFLPASLLLVAMLPVSACKKEAPATQANPTPSEAHQGTASVAASGGPTTQTPYKVYQGVQSPYDYKGARVCLVYGKEEHCWNAGDYISEVTAKPITLRSGRRLILVTALSMGGSDGTLDLALLDEQSQQPVNLLPSVELASANAGQWDDWLIEEISPMPIILTADPVWSDDITLSNAEARAAAHQFGITTYSYNAAAAHYSPQLAYVTSGKYPGGKDVIALERPAIMAGLKGAAGN